MFCYQTDGPLTRLGVGRREGGGWGGYNRDFTEVI